MRRHGKTVKHARDFTDSQPHYAYTIPYSTEGTDMTLLNIHGLDTVKEAHQDVRGEVLSGNWCLARAADWRESPRLDPHRTDGFRPPYAPGDVVIVQASPFRITSAVVLWEKKNAATDFAYTCSGHVYHLTGPQLSYEQFMQKHGHLEREKLNK